MLLLSLWNQIHWWWKRLMSMVATGPPAQKAFTSVNIVLYHNHLSAPSLLIWQIGFPLFAFFFSFSSLSLRVFLFLFGFISLFFFIVFYLIFLLLSITTGTWVELILLLMVPFNTLILLCIFSWKYNVHTENCTNYKGTA